MTSNKKHPGPKARVSKGYSVSRLLEDNLLREVHALTGNANHVDASVEAGEVHGGGDGSGLHDLTLEVDHFGLSRRDAVEGEDAASELSLDGASSGDRLDAGRTASATALAERTDLADLEITRSTGSAFELQLDSSSLGENVGLVNSLAPATLLELGPSIVLRSASRSLGNGSLVVVVFGHGLFVFNTEFDAEADRGFVGQADAAPSGDVDTFLVLAPDVEAEASIRIVVAVTEGDGSLDTTVGFNERAVEVAVGVFFDISRERNGRRTAIVFIVVFVSVTSGLFVRTRFDLTFGIDGTVPKESGGNFLSKCQSGNASYSSECKFLVHSISLFFNCESPLEGTRFNANISFFLR